MRKFFVVLFGPQFDNFTSVLNYKMGCWRAELAILRNFSIEHVLPSYFITAAVSAVFYYSFIMIFSLNNVVLAETWLAYYANSSSFGVLGTDVFAAIEVERIARLDELLDIIALPALQYDTSVSKEHFFIFISNQLQLLKFAMCYLGIFSLARFNLEVLCLPFIAPTLSSMGCFDNSAKLEYGNLPYSAFIQKGLINLCTVLCTDGTVELGPQDRRLTFLFLNYLVDFCLVYA